MEAAWEVADLVLDRLIDYDPNLDLVPALAEQVPTLENGGISEDGKTYTFHLRKDVTWQDGEPFTSEDVAFGLRVTQDPDSGVIKTVPVELESVETPDDYTVVVALKAPNAGFLPWIAQFFVPLPEHALKDVQDWLTAEYLTKPWPGTGAFEFVEWERGSHILVEKNPNYYGEGPYLDSIIYRVMPSDDARLTALETGEADIVLYPSGELVLRAKELPGVKVYETPGFASFQFFLNLRDPILKDARTRQALTHAVDKQKILDTVVYGLGTVKWSPLSPLSWAWIDVEHRYTYDPATAQELLEQVGWKDADGDGIREAHGVEGVPDGTKLALEILNVTGPAERLQVCQIVQEEWQAVGAQVDVATVDVSTFIGRAFGFDSQVGYYHNTWSPEPSTALWHWHPTQGPNWSGLGTIYPDLPELLDRAALSMDTEVSGPLYAEFQQLFAERAIEIFLYDRVWCSAVNEKIQNFTQMPGGGVHTWNANEWWIEP
jgi:peptide/nickel transport system substrate-binding protein